MLCYIFRLSLKQSYSKNKQTKMAQLLRHSQSSMKLMWASAEDNAIFNLVMLWSRAIVFGTWVTTVKMYPGRDTFEFDQRQHWILIVWPRINQSQCSFCWVKVYVYINNICYYHMVITDIVYIIIQIWILSVITLNFDHVTKNQPIPMLVVISESLGI